MSLEGNLRDLALAEVLQLLAHTRKSGELQLKAPLAGLSARILFEAGSIVGAESTSLVQSNASGELISPAGAPAVEQLTHELLCWNEGEFRFVPHPVDASWVHTSVRLNTELLLMEAARRSEDWVRLSDRIPNSRAVPTFADVEPRQLPLLNLQPQQWEVLTGVDGHRDLPALARSLGRDLLEVAQSVHELIGTGLLKLADVTRVQRTQATPPSSASLPEGVQAELWVPAGRDIGRDDYDHYDHDDEIFDPIRVGVITPDGLPKLRTPIHVACVPAVGVENHGAVVPEGCAALRQRGDAAARRGDLAEAVHYWREVLRSGRAAASSGDESASVATVHAAEAMALATRLQALLNIKETVSADHANY